MSIQVLAIREQVARRLEGGTLADGRVYRSRIFPLDVTLLPAVLVWAGDETVEEYNAEPGSRLRTVRIWVEAVGKFKPEIDYVLEVIAAQAQALLQIDETLGNPIQELELATVLRPEPVKDGKFTFATVRLGFDVAHIEEIADAVDLDDWNELLAKYDLAPPDTVLEATDEIDLT